MKKTTVISSARDCFIEVTHRNSDPGVWIVRRWTRFLCLKKRISSDWFNDENQAMAFANKMKKGHDGHLGHRVAMETFQNAE
jgi:hypothetical protein